MADVIETIPAFDSTSLIVTISGYAPVGRFGTTMFACARPANPGVMPENTTCAGSPPMVAVVGPAVGHCPATPALGIEGEQRGKGEAGGEEGEEG